MTSRIGVVSMRDQPEVRTSGSENPTWELEFQPPALPPAYVVIVPLHKLLSDAPEDGLNDAWAFAPVLLVKLGVQRSSTPSLLTA